MPLVRHVTRVRVLLIGALAACCLVGNAPVCSDCSSDTAWLTLDDGTKVHARLHVPLGGGANLPAVVVIHGYLGNVGFVEMPWAADLTDLGIVALFLDRRGHGKSSGEWRPRPENGTRHLGELTPDIRAAVAYLRKLTPLVDPQRIALLGHSDGATGAIIAGSADWELAATVSLSASVAPWEYVNYVAPHNLLLLYGSEDRFILTETDKLLIRAATRGYLNGEGQLGSLGDGSARRLERVDGYGHVDLLYSSSARRAALDWLAHAFGIDRDVHLSPLRWPWVAAGLTLLLLLVFSWNGAPSLPSPQSLSIFPGARLPPFEKGELGGKSEWINPRRKNRQTPHEPWLVRAGKALVIGALWTGGLWVAARVGPTGRNLPVQEGNTVTSILLATGSLMAGVALAALLSRRRGWWRDWNARQLFGAAARGALAALVVELIAEAILHPIYAPAVNGQRLALFLGCLVLAAPVFAAMCTAVNWLPNGQIAPRVPVELLLGLLTGGLAMPWFVRMSAFPVLLFACVLLFVAAYRAGGGTAIGAAVFGAILYARVASAVCAFY